MKCISVKTGSITTLPNKKQKSIKIKKSYLKKTKEWLGV